MKVWRLSDVLEWMQNPKGYRRVPSVCGESKQTKEPDENKEAKGIYRGKGLAAGKRLGRVKADTGKGEENLIRVLQGDREINCVSVRHGAGPAKSDRGSGPALSNNGGGGIMKIEFIPEEREQVKINGKVVGEMWPNGTAGYYCTLKIPPLGAGDSLFGTGATREETIQNALAAGRKEQDKLSLLIAKYQEACDWLENALGVEG
jgi:hypothetical protein